MILIVVSAYVVILRHHVLGDVVHGGRGGALRAVPVQGAGHSHAVARGQGRLPPRVRALPRLRHQVPRVQPVHRGQRPRRIRKLQVATAGFKLILLIQYQIFVTLSGYINYFMV